MLRLNLGCADRHIPGWTNVDIVPPADLISDLSQRWPWDDSTADAIKAEDIFEHLPDRIHTMNETWRVLRHMGMAEIIVPSAAEGAGFAQDPTHKSAWCANSFQYFEHGSFAFERLAKSYGIIGGFRIVSLEKKIYQDKYEPVVKIHVTLQAIKL